METLSIWNSTVPVWNSSSCRRWICTLHWSPVSLHTFAQNLLAVLQPVLRKLTIPDWRKAHGLLRWLEVHIYMPLSMFWLGLSIPILSHATKGFFQNRRFIQMHRQGKVVSRELSNWRIEWWTIVLLCRSAFGVFWLSWPSTRFSPETHLQCSVCFSPDAHFTHLSWSVVSILPFSTVQEQAGCKVATTLTFQQVCHIHCWSHVLAQRLVLAFCRFSYWPWESSAASLVSSLTAWIAMVL